jgi:hypothetical protein
MRLCFCVCASLFAVLVKLFVHTSVVHAAHMHLSTCPCHCGPRAGLLVMLFADDGDS